jgi:hypothetical protein
MDEVVKQGWALFVAAPVIWLVVSGTIAVGAWRLAKAFYEERIETLRERLSLAHDRLTASSEELEKVKAEGRTALEAVGEFPRSDVWRLEKTPEATPFSAAPWSKLFDEFATKIDKTIDANNATAAVSTVPQRRIVSGVLRRKSQPDDDDLRPVRHITP